MPRPALFPMAMGKRKRHAKQSSMWVATQDLPRNAAHPFYVRLNQILDQTCAACSPMVPAPSCTRRIDGRSAPPLSRVWNNGR
jgi:hypothetical protein